MLRKVFLTIFIILLSCALWGQIIVNEIMYNSPSYDREWIELLNITDSDFLLDSTYVLTDGEGEYHFEGIEILSGQYLTVYVYSYGSDTTGLYFTPDVDARGHGIQLNNDSDQVVIRYIPDDTTLDSVQYYDDWAPGSDGGGFTLSRRDPYGESNDPTNWGTSADSLGTPGEENNVVKIKEKTTLPSNLKISVSPNPFNSSCVIFVETQNLAFLPEIAIYDLRGNLIATPYPAGAGFVPLDKGDSEIAKQSSRGFIWTPDEKIPSGIYLVRATILQQNKSVVCTKRIVYLK
ncbi:lamin tail domain-containing protein [bacterium]|nr:lamin tail domain-containing protein [bacterium]